MQWLAPKGKSIGNFNSTLLSLQKLISNTYTRYEYLDNSFNRNYGAFYINFW